METEAQQKRQGSRGPREMGRCSTASNPKSRPNTYIHKYPDVHNTSRITIPRTHPEHGPRGPCSAGSLRVTCKNASIRPYDTSLPCLPRAAEIIIDCTPCITIPLWRWGAGAYDEEPKQSEPHLQPFYSKLFACYSFLRSCLPPCQNSWQTPMFRRKEAPKRPRQRS